MILLLAKNTFPALSGEIPKSRNHTYTNLIDPSRENRGVQMDTKYGSTQSEYKLCLRSILH